MTRWEQNDGQLVDSMPEALVHRHEPPESLKGYGYCDLGTWLPSSSSVDATVQVMGMGAEPSHGCTYDHIVKQDHCRSSGGGSVSIPR